MVTTRITEALPITRPRAVRKARNLLARRALREERRASRWNMLPRNFLQQIFGSLARGIVGRKVALQILLQQLARFIQVAVLADVGLGAGKEHLGTSGGHAEGLLEHGIALGQALAGSQRL